MEHTQKMFLVPQQQLDSLKQQQQQEQNSGSIRQTVQNELDRAMIDVLKLPDIDMYEKAKKYSNILQRYLSMVRQGEREKGVLTLSLPVSDTHGSSLDATPSVDNVNSKKDPILDEVLKHMPKRSLKNAEYILEAITRSKNLISWTDQGEIVINNQPVRGTHLYDLVKSVTASHHTLDSSRPRGWELFLKTLGSLNVPLSAIPNTLVRRSISEYKGGDNANSESNIMTHDKPTTRKRGKHSLNGSPRFNTPIRTSRAKHFKSPRMDSTEWFYF